MGNGRRDWLMVREKGGAEDRVEIAAAPLRIGRSSDNQVVLRDGFASARHAELVDHGSGRGVRDLGSTNGTRLNGRVIAPGVTHPLRDGDVIRIGSTELTFERGPAPARAAGDSRQPRRGGDAGRAATVAAHGEPLSSIFPEVRSRRHEAWARARRIALRVGLVVAVLVILLAASAWLMAPPRMVLLVMGSDARPDELRRGEVGRTDTMLAIIADRAPAGALLISIPRDLWVSIPGFGEERINVAYPVGGPRAAERVVSDVLGIPLDRYLVIGLQGVRDIVYAAGGVEVDVERPIHDEAYPTDDYGTVVVDIPAGRQHMDGETALRYARTRHQDNDFGRMARQQRVMVALRTAMLKPVNWWRIPAVLAAVRRATQTDVGVRDLVTLVLAFGTSSTEPERLALGPGLVEEFRGGDGAYLLRATPALRQRVAAVLNPANAGVEILNGTRTDGLGRQAADTLRGRGMRVVNVGSAAPRPDTIVEVAPGFARAGASAASALDVPREAIRESAVLPAGVDVRITLGEERSRS